MQKYTYRIRKKAKKEIIKCKICKIKFILVNSKRGKIFCSRKCYFKYRVGENNNSWKGNNVKYRGLHAWVSKEMGKANHCVKCKLNKIPKNKTRYFQWSNISQKYKRDLKDWQQLCIKCHKEYDATHLGKGQTNNRPR